jgi:hypothetical protein
VSTAADEIRLTIPGSPDFHRVAHLVVGGLAVRLGLTIENLEDLQLALDAVLSQSDGSNDVTMTMTVREGELVTCIGPLPAGVLDEIERDVDDHLGVRRVLEASVDDVRVDGDTVRLTKRVAGRG